VFGATFTTGAGTPTGGHSMSHTSEPEDYEALDLPLSSTIPCYSLFTSNKSSERCSPPASIWFASRRIVLRDTHHGRIRKSRFVIPTFLRK